MYQTITDKTKGAELQINYICQEFGPEKKRGCSGYYSKMIQMSIIRYVHRTQKENNLFLEQYFFPLFLFLLLIFPFPYSIFLPTCFCFWLGTFLQAQRVRAKTSAGDLSKIQQLKAPYKTRAFIIFLLWGLGGSCTTIPIHHNNSAPTQNDDNVNKL